MKKTWILTLALLLVVGAAVTVSIAEAGPGGPHGPHMHGGAMAALNLSDDQKASVQKLREDMMTQAQPLWQQASQQMSDIKALLDTGKADATDIGKRVIAAHATRQQLKALHDDFNTKFSALLTADQQAQFAKIQAERQAQRSEFQGRRGHGFGGPPPEF